MSLQQLSDTDLNRLYNDAKAGIRKGTDYNENDGDDYGGYTPLDFYTGQTMSSDYEGIGGKKERELMELSDLYRNNVYTDYEGGRLGNESIREGFTKIFDEKERRRVQYIDDGRYKPPAEEAPKVEAKKEEEYKPRPKVEVDLESIKPFEPQIDGQQGASYMGQKPAGDPVKAKEKAQAFKATSKPDYSFEGGAYGAASVKGASAYGGKPAATDGVAGGSSADAYGNVPAADMNAEHQAEQLKNTHLSKAKTALI